MDIERIERAALALDGAALAEETAEWDALTREELDARLAAMDDVEVRVAPGARAWVWRDGHLVPLDRAEPL
jgi:hypothetical protein